ncbi:MAG: type II secretion protein F [Actinomycetales bacterium]|nr:type II secretion protein F [Actinomycetales bacterium]
MSPVAGRRVRALERSPVERTTRLAAGEALALVAARLRAGADPGRAWSGIEVSDDGPAATVHAAERLARELGAPLAEVLDEVAAGVADDEAAEAERRAALAGPASTARVLVWLPVGGILLGLVLGAGVLGVALDGRIGSVCAVVGVLLLAAGRAWTRLLVRAARRA